MSIGKIIRTLSTEDDADQIWDPLRIQFIAGCVASILAMMVFLGLAIYHTVHDKDFSFDPTAFGTGFMALLGGFGTYITGTGVALYMNAKAPSS